MPISSRRCGMITKREAERLCKSFLGDNSPPKLPENFAFEVRRPNWTRNWSETKNILSIDFCFISYLLNIYLVTRYTMNVHGDVVVSLFPLDTTHQEQSASNAPFVLFSFPQTSLSSILTDFLRKMINTFNQTPLILTLGEDTLNYLVIHPK